MADPEGGSQTEFILAKKKVDAMIAMLRVAKRVGVEHEEFLSCAHEQVGFLSMAPPVEANLFPRFIRNAAKRAVFERAEAAPSAWKLLSPKDLSLGDTSVSMGQIHDLQRELLADKIVCLQQTDPAGLAASLGNLLGDPAAFLDAQLSDGDLLQVEALALVVKAAGGASICDGGDLKGALEMVQNPELSVANALTLYLPGRSLVQKAEDSMKVASDLLAKVGEFRTAVKASSAVIHLADFEWQSNVEVVETALVRLGSCFQRFTETELQHAEGEVSSMWAFVKAWVDAVLVSVLGVVEQQLHGRCSEDSKQMHLKLIRCLLGFMRPGLTPEALLEKAPPLEQAMSLFDLVERGLKIADDARDLDLPDCAFAKQNFADFKFHESWVAADSQAASTAVARTQRLIVDTCFSPSVQKRAFDAVTHKHGLHAAVQNFIDQLPPEYKTCEIPAMVEAIDDADLMSKLACVADPRLRSQVVYISMHHRALRAASELAQARGTGRRMGAEGGRTPCDPQHAVLVSTLRQNLAAVDVQAGAVGDAFMAAGDGEIHLALLDGHIQPSAFTEVVRKACLAELSIWRAAWARQVDEHARAIDAGVPEGWLSVKDTLLEDANQGIVTAMLTNKNYVSMCAALAAIIHCMATLKSFRNDGCGPFLEVNVLSSATCAMENGTLTVGVTYALFQLQDSLQKMPPGASRKAKVKELRQELYAKCGSIRLGSSIEEELARLNC